MAPKIAILTTTIHKATAATLKFLKIAEENNYTFLIVGDLKTPHEEYEDLAKKYSSLKYLHPKFQYERYPELSKSIGWNTIQRRNIAFVEAYNAYDVDWVATVDDDNIPNDDWGREFSQQLSADKFSISELEAYDPLACVHVSDRNSPFHFAAAEFWHRGYPLSLRAERKRTLDSFLVTAKSQSLKFMTPDSDIAVYAPLWHGDPDIDALARLVYAPDVYMKACCQTGYFFSDTLSPFNSQNTIIRKDLLPYYAVLPHVGRMDDIWGSYHLQKVMKLFNKKNSAVVYGKPSVTQERNPQDLIKNLENETLGYRHTLQFIREEIPSNGMLPEVDYLPEATREFFQIYHSQFKGNKEIASTTRGPVAKSISSELEF